ncbi:MAG TPA: zinc-ribbon domain-containing protein [Candidatus Binataceae bacterium]|nr:zinc-ribbon domain-containing protein [Candidatus Binataceae bacterium]
MLYLAAAMIVAGVAMFVAAPLAGGLLPARVKKAADLDAERLEHERGLAVQGLRELDFDREMGKLSDADYEALRVTLETRALAAMQSLENLRLQADSARAAASAPVLRPALHLETPRRVEPPRVVQPPAFGLPRATSSAPRNLRFCPQCGARTINDARFCGECGLALRPAGRATGWND